MNNWKKIKIEEVCSFINGYAFDSNKYVQNGIQVIRITNVQKGYISDTDKKFYKEEKELERYKLIEDDLLISLTGNVGRVGVIKSENLPAYLNQRVSCVRIKNNNLLNKRFLFNFLNSDSFEKTCIKNSKGIAQKNISTVWLREIKIPLPAMEEQKKIAARLDAVSDLLAKQKQLLAEQDTLIQSTFYDMFGDPIKNEKGWNSKKLSELGSLKNGINFQKNDNESDLYCLGVADFKDNKYISDISALQKVPSKSVNLTEDLLKNGDIVFVRSNGNKALVGRCVAVYPNEEAVTFSGFCIRFRKSTTLIKTDYLLYFLKTPQVRNALAGRGANIQNLNQQILSRVNILCPPLELQQKFAAIAEQIESEKSKIKSAIAETQTLFNALMSEYFEE